MDLGLNISNYDRTETIIWRLFLCVLLFLLVGCSPSGSSKSPTPLPPAGDVLFLESEYSVLASPEPTETRSRFVEMNLDLLLEANGTAKDLGQDAELTINLFPDTVYLGVIQQITSESGTTTWTGYLKDIEYSSLILVYTGDVFIGHFASPLGVYEVSNISGDTYQVIQVDQNALQEGYLQP